MVIFFQGIVVEYQLVVLVYVLVGLVLCVAVMAYYLHCDRVEIKKLDELIEYYKKR